MPLKKTVLNCDQFGSFKTACCPLKTLPKMKSFMMGVTDRNDGSPVDTSALKPERIKQIDNEFCSDCLAFIPL